MPQRVLFINHPEGDYGGAFLYNGLCQILGAANVYDCPIKLSYHGKTHRYSTPAIDNGCTCPFAWFSDGHACAWESETLSPQEAIAEAEELLRQHHFSLVVVESLRTLAVATLRKLLPAIRNSGTPIVIHDGEDYLNIDVSSIQEFTPAAYLKREMPKGTQLIQKVDNTLRMAFPFSAPITELSQQRKVADIEFQVAIMFGDTFQLRRDLVHEFRSKYEGRMYTAISADTSHHTQRLQQWEGYLKTMATAHIGVSARGYGRDTCRYWELPGVTAMLCDNVDLAIPFAFEDKHTCFMYNTAAEAVAAVRNYAGTDLCGMVYHNGREHLLKYHTNKARAAYLLDTLATEGVIQNDYAQ